VVDNGSTDNTKKIVYEAIKKFTKLNIRYIYEPEPGLLAARHKGVFEAKGEIVIFIDDDIEVTSDWFFEIYKTFKDKNIHLVGGKCLPKYEIIPPFWEKNLWEKKGDSRFCVCYSLVDLGDKIKEVDPLYVFGLNFAVRRKTLFDLGGFHPDTYPKKYQRFQGDGETGLAFKMKKKGSKAIYNPKIKVYHFITKERLTIKYLEERMFFQGVCDSYSNIRKNQGVTAKRLKSSIIESIFAATNLFKEKIFKSKYNVSAKDLQMKMTKAYKNGYNFHQTEVRRDSKLLAWVLKENYFDYRLPI
jgi:glycosyltransferase involved in cell wall biosynthesis